MTITGRVAGSIPAGRIMDNQDKNNDDMEKIRKLAREGKIEFASQDRIKYLDAYVEQVLDALGHPEAFVSDESTISDFIDLDKYWTYSEDDDAHHLNAMGAQRLAEISQELGVEINCHDYIWEIAKKLAG